MTPLGHVAVTLLARRAIRRCAGIALDARGMLIGGTLPDLDFLLLPVGRRERVHRTFFHSPLAVLGGALLLCPWVPVGATLCGGLLHLLVDNLWGGNPPGVAWFFPVDRRRRLLGFELGMRSGTARGRLRALVAEAAVVLAAFVLLLGCSLPGRPCLSGARQPLPSSVS